MNGPADEGNEEGEERARSVLTRLASPSSSGLPLPRLLLIFAHPDDEVLAVGARLERLRQSRFLTVTDGAPVDGMDAHQHGFASLEAYREGRRRELLAALGDAGILPAAVPSFAAAVEDQAASFHLPGLARAMADEIEAFAPEAVLTHPYEGGHPDHDACAFAVNAAVRLFGARRPDKETPVILEAPFYHADGDGGMATGSFLTETVDRESATVVCELTAEERRSKQRRLACFASQAETLAQFGTERELFRRAPACDFFRPPHSGRLFYEQFPWGMSGERFRRLAQEATTALFAEPEPGSTGLAGERVGVA